MHIEYTFEDKTGKTRPDSVTFIDSIVLDYKDRTASLQIITYNSMTDFQNSKLPICSEDIRIDPTDFDIYFDETELNKLDNNPLGKAYEVLMLLLPENSINDFDFKNSGTLVT